MEATRSSTKRSTGEAKSDLSVSYDEFKEYEGQRYTGMKIGRSHKWYYDQGEWKEKKITPDLWQIGYAVTKRRAGRAPEGSGVPVGTESCEACSPTSRSRTTARSPLPARAKRVHAGAATLARRGQP